VRQKLKVMSWTIATAIGLVGGVVACSETAEPVGPSEMDQMDVSGGGNQPGGEPQVGPQLGAPISGWVRIASECPSPYGMAGSPATRSTTSAALYIQCGDVWSPNPSGATANDIPVGTEVVFICDPVGTTTNGGSTWRSAKLPTSLYGLYIEEQDPYIDAHYGDVNFTGHDYMKLTIRGLRPANGQTMLCILDGLRGVYFNVDVTGPAPYLNQMAINGATSVDWGFTTQLTPRYRDQYGYWDLLGSPTTTWQSSDVNIATVSSSGLVTGVKAGSVQVKACAMNGATQVCSPWYSMTVRGTVVTHPQQDTEQLLQVGSSGSTTYMLKNNTTVSKSISLSCVASGNFYCGTVSPSSVTLAAGDSASISVGYTTGTWGSGNLRLNATGGGTAIVYYLVQGGPLSSVIDYGPSSVKPGVECEWMASASGGYTPYSWQWTVDGTPVTGAANDLVYTNAKSSGQSFQLGVTVTDGTSTLYTAYKTVTVSSAAPACVL
jgi:hypothetical protein